MFLFFFFQLLWSYHVPHREFSYCPIENINRYNTHFPRRFTLDYTCNWRSFSIKKCEIAFFFFEFRKTKNQLLNPIDLLCIIHHLKMSINLSLYFLFIFYFPLFLFPCTFDSIQSHNCQNYMKDEHYCNQRTHFLKYSGI